MDDQSASHLAPYEAVKGSIRHVRPMSRQLRAAACMTLQGFGYDPRKALHKAFMQSFYCRTALMNGSPVAMWGVTGTLLSCEAFVWLVLSDRIANIPLSIVREAKSELSRIMQNYDELATTVLPDDEAAIRFAVYLGFHDRHDSDERLSRREIQQLIMTDPKYRIPIGDSFVIALGYHGGH